MAEQGEADQIVNNEAGDSSNGTDALRRRLADIYHRACELESEINRQKTACEVDPDNRADNFAYHLKACRRVLQSLEQEFFTCAEDLDDCPLLHMVDKLLFRVLEESIWNSWLNDLKERGERHSMLREEIKVVEGMPVIKITQNHLNENIECACCKSHRFEIAEEACHLACNEGCIFYKLCIERWFKLIADINDQACDMRSEIIRVKTAYEADPDNQVDNFAYKLKMFQEALDYLLDNFYEFEYPSPECKRYGDQLEGVNLIFAELIDLIWKCCSHDMAERVERQMEREIIQVVKGLPAVKNSENHMNEDDVCAICLSDPEVAEEQCHLRCNEGHKFHRNCIEQWLNMKNQCPICRTPAYRPKLYFYPAVLDKLETMDSIFRSHDSLDF